jgi:tRNA(fMet)-specific endonuclease VapC
MTSQVYLLDTNVITGIMKKDACVLDRISQALAADAHLILSPLVFYEIKRGLMRRDAKRQLGFFEQLIKTFWWNDLQRTDWQRAAELWANEIAHGRPPQDADLLIAAQAHRLKAIVVTANEDHFTPLGVKIENWLA